MKDLKGEKRVDTIGFEGLYEISNYGRVKSLFRIVMRKDGREMTVKSRILAQEHKNKSGGKKSYARVALSKEGMEYNIPVHKLMTESGIKLKKTT